MSERFKTIRHTFAENHGITPGILQMIADITKYSVTSFAEREEASKKYYEMLRKANTRDKSSNPIPQR